MNHGHPTRNAIQTTMTFIGALAAGIEHSIGPPSKAMAYHAGKTLGKQLSSDLAPTDDPIEALNSVRQILIKNECLWHFEPRSGSSQSGLIKTYTKHDPETNDPTMNVSTGDIEIELIFRDCMIRQSLIAFGHAQGQSICSLMYGFFTGAIETIMHRRSTLTILHTGPNACLKKLLIKGSATE